MNKKIVFSYKSFFRLIVTIILVLVVILQLPTLLTYIQDTSDNRIIAIIGAVGNITGGIIGGIVAYLVANYQVSKSKEHQEFLDLKHSYFNLRLLLDEIEYNKKIMLTIQTESNLPAKSKFLANHLTDDRWNKTPPTFADNLSNDDFKEICNLYRNIAFIKSNDSTIEELFITQTNTLIIKLSKIIRKELDFILTKLN
ncbi:hypothetical protein [Cytobacillus horneckiae]|uniref:hypothetical protein n=1 Tax=Cytobacillus horneckiae TaxID=549687 RepID=UPI003D23784E